MTEIEIVSEPLMRGKFSAQHLNSQAQKQYGSIVNLPAFLFVTIFRMVFDAVHIFVSLLATGHRTRKRFFIRCTIASRSRMSTHNGMEW